MDKSISIFILLLFFTVEIYSQQNMKIKQLDNTNNIEKILQLGKKNIIDLAVQHLKNDDSFQNFNINLFDKLCVYYDDKYVWVSFSQSIRYVPRNSAFAYGVTVFLYGQEGTSCSLLKNPENQDAARPYSFYQYSDNDRQTLAEILKFIKTKPGESIYETITIYDNPDYYDIEMMTESSGESYKIQKSNMSIYDELFEELDLLDENETMELE